MNTTRELYIDNMIQGADNRPRKDKTMTDRITEIMIILQTLEELREREEGNLIHELLLEAQEAY